MMDARALGGHAMGAAAYAIKAAVAAAAEEEGESTRRRECAWQCDQLRDEVRHLVLADQMRRNDICWRVFDPA